MQKTRDLYTTKDVAEVREALLKAQDGYDTLTLTPIEPGQACLDHNHKTQFVRAVLNRQTNAALGKLEGVYTRYLSYWYKGTLSTFLRQAADYIERPDDERYRHPHWVRKLKTQFSKLPEAKKRLVLEGLGQQDGKNATERKAIFSRVVMQRDIGYSVIKEVLDYTEKGL